jgi:formylglycine-generating enzyme required for sulfatase activity/class 3 adenylate cyclase
MSSEDTTPGNWGGTSSHVGTSARRLAAILSADIKDFSRLMGMDEEGTLARIKRYRREIIDPTTAEHHGRIIKTTGDGYLAIFDSPLEAVRCAIVIQQSLLGRNASLPKQAWMRFRIGVNLGDVLIDPDDIYGDGVNIAARLQGLAEPGSVYISGGVYEQIKNKLVCGYQSLGDERLKNITDPVRIYRVLPDPEAVSQAKRRNRIRATIAACVLVVAGAAGWYVLRPGTFTQAEEPRPQQQASIPPVIAPAPPPAAVRPTPAETPRASEPRAAPSPPPLPPISPHASEPRAAPSPQPLPPVSPPAATAPTPAPQAALPSPPPQPAPQAAPRPPAPAPMAVPAPAAPESIPPAAAPPAAPTQVAVAVIKPPRMPVQPGTDVFRDCDQCPEMVNLPGGTFAMGSNDDPSEKPIHQVNVASFALGRFAVTIGEWKQCVAAKACSYEPTGDDDMPASNLSWNDAQQYVGWLSNLTKKRYRLPTEAEWEYAARAGAGTKYWWGNQLVAGMANCKDCGDGSDQRRPMKVASFTPNPFGLFDMTGGIEQWVADCWHRNYDGAPRDGSSWETQNCRERVLRGGSYRSDASYLRAASRNRYDAGVRYLAHGLRVAR